MARANHRSAAGRPYSPFRSAPLILLPSVPRLRIASRALFSLRALQALAVDYARSHMRSELAWTKAKLVVVAHMASGLRTKLAQAQAERAQAGGLAGRAEVP